MAEPPAELQIGRHRPVYLWAGPGTVRMNRLKFMGAPVDEMVHAEAHTPGGAWRMAEQAGFNWAYLMYNWGFPPEIEAEDHQDFERAVPAYHAAGIKVFGYIQASNCVDAGSYREKDWYALDPAGRRFNYYTGRFMTCWLHPEWRAHLGAMVAQVIAAGADGVFFDNPWHAAQPLHLGGVWLGAAGCCCPRCRAAFRGASGLEIPAHVIPEREEASRAYLRWRAGVVSATLAELAGIARRLKPDVVVSANDFDAVMRPSYLTLGIDLEALARVQDVIMIEDYGLPRWEESQPTRRPGGPPSAPRLVNNALTIRTARVLTGETPLSVDPYDQGIGFDEVYPPWRLQQGLAEAAACGAMMVVKGTEYVEKGAFTLLSAESFAPQRLAIGSLHRWLEQHAALYQGRVNAAPVGLLYPEEAFWQRWDEVAPRYFAAGQTLLAAGIPWRTARAGGDFSGLQALLAFGPPPPGAALPPGLRLIQVDRLPGWKPPRLPRLAGLPGVRQLLGAAAGGLYRAYFRWRWARRWGDRLGLVHIFLQAPYFRLPPAAMRKALLAALGPLPGPQVHSRQPVLVEAWRQGESWQLHLVNYASRPQAVEVVFEQAVIGQRLAPGQAVDEFQADRLAFELEVYAVLQGMDRPLTQEQPGSAAWLLRDQENS